MLNCNSCIWRVRLKDGVIYCSWNGFYVGETDVCTNWMSWKVLEVMKDDEVANG